MYDNFFLSDGIMSVEVTFVLMFPLLRRLEKLDVMFGTEKGAPEYVAGLARAMPALRELRVDFDFSVDDEWSLKPIVDLIQGAAKSLRLVYLNTCEGYPDTLNACLSKCVNLERVQASGDEAPTLAAMRCLKKLKHFEQLYLYPSKRDVDGFAACLQKVETLCSELPELQFINLRIYHCSFGASKAPLIKLCQQSAAAVKRRRPGVEVRFNPA